MVLSSARAGWTSVGARLGGSSRGAMVASVDDAEPLRAASEIRADAGAALDASLADSETLRDELARLLAKAAPSADADARRAGVGVDEGERDLAAEGGLGASEVDALVTRLRALHGARDACVRQMRVEGALREARVVADAVASSGVADRDATLDRLELAAGALAAAADALADAARDAARDANPPRRSRRDARSRSSPEPDPWVLDPSDADDGASRLVFAASARLESLALALRAPLEDVLAAAAASTGWPPPLNPAATESFRWPLADDDVVDPRRALPRAVAVAGILERAAQGVPRVPSREGVPTSAGVPTPIPSASWASRALARPVEAKLREHFGEKGVASARPELLFACASRAARALAPLARDRLLAAGAFDHLDDAPATSRGGGASSFSAGAGVRTRDPRTRDVESRRFAVGFAARLAVAAATVASDHHAASLEASESTTGAGARRAASRSRPSPANADVPWLHLADECEAFDRDVDALTRELAESEASGSASGSAVLPARTIRALASVDAVERSALARLATTSAPRRERWIAAELADCVRAVDAACDDPNGSGWTPMGVGVVGVGYEEGDPDPALAHTADADAIEPILVGTDDGTVRVPAAEATCDAFRRAAARAAAMPPGARVARDGLVDLVARLGGGGLGLGGLGSGYGTGRRVGDGSESDSPESSSLDARAAYLSEVAGGVADHFVRRARRRVAADDAFGALASGDDGRAGALVAGACVAAVLRVAAQMAETQEEPETLDVAPDFFADRVAAAETLADEWTETLVDAAEGAYAEAAAKYEGGVHLLTFAREETRTETGIDAGEDGSRTSEGEDEDASRSRSASSPSSPSSALASPLETLRERLSGLRAALALADASGARGRRAIRRLANRVADRTVREVALCAAFSRAGGERFARDVDAIVGAFGAYLRKPRVALARAVEAAALLAIDAERAAAFTTALGRRAKLEAEAEKKAEAEKETAEALAEAGAAVDAWREKLGIRNVGDELAFTILARRTDMGASAGR